MSAVNVESSYRCAFEPPPIATPSPSYYPWLAPHSHAMPTPMLSLPNASYVPQLQSTPPLQLPPIISPQFRAVPSPLLLPAPTPTASASPSSSSPHVSTPISHAPPPFVTYPQPTSTIASSMHLKGGNDYESTASNIGDLKDMMTNYMNQLNENIKAMTLDVNFLKRQQNLLSARRPEPDPTKVVCQACGLADHISTNCPTVVYTYEGCLGRGHTEEDCYVKLRHMMKSKSPYPPSGPLNHRTQNAKQPGPSWTLLQKEGVASGPSASIDPMSGPSRENPSINMIELSTPCVGAITRKGKEKSIEFCEESVPPMLAPASTSLSLSHPPTHVLDPVHEPLLQPRHKRSCAPTNGDGESCLWSLYFDGACHGKDKLGSYGIVIYPPEGDAIILGVLLGDHLSNNVAEYQALLIGLRAVLLLGAADVHIYGDSQLVVHQFHGQACTIHPLMHYYSLLVRDLFTHFTSSTLTFLPHHENTEADPLH
ncbi:hypothetical protein L7F22_004961 [Adiantum nelumboides]|nr:hypothetical protein [Adiantum nelumboides]